jgi:hypothetical protein
MMFHFYIPKGICFAALVAFVARGYTMQFLICVFCCVFVSKQRSRFLQEYKSETSYTPEDGHGGRNM